MKNEMEHDVTEMEMRKLEGARRRRTPGCQV